MNNLSGGVSLSVNLKPEAHSVLSIPSTSASTEEDGSFLHFINNRQPDGGRRLGEECASLVSKFD